MKFRKTLLAAMVLSSGMAFAYEEITDETGATEPPQGAGDNSFVEGARPEMIGGEDAGNDSANENAATTTETEQRTVERQPQTSPQDQLSADERRAISQERQQRITQVPQSKGAMVGDASQTGASSQNAEMFIILDQDRDGTVSRYEAESNNQLTENFSDVDADEDGLLSADEIDNWEGLDEIDE